MRIAAIAMGYPSDASPAAGTFVHELMRALRQLGAEPTVVTPLKWTPKPPWRSLRPEAPLWEERDGVPIRHPCFRSYSNKRLPLGISTFRWTVTSFVRAVVKEGTQLRPRPDVCYGHFLYPSGRAARRLAEHLKAPSVVALGESSFDHYEDHFGLQRVRRDLRGFTAVLAVSEEIRARCVERYDLPSDRIAVFPNGVDTHLFHPQPRREMRARLGLPLARPIVAFVGPMVERKGPLRLLEALQGLPEVGALFIGTGPQTPSGPQVLHTGPVPHERVPEWLSAADLFVLPTLAEGNSNAILEAMACGLPVISSDRPFNQGLVDSSVGVLIDPTDPRAIREAIRQLVADRDSRLAMGRAAAARAQGRSLTDRAERILAWLEALAERAAK